jgi:hypothetical protein
LNRIHALAASTIIGLSAVFGVAATTKSTGVGEPKPAVSKLSDAQIAARQRKLNRAQKALRKARAQKPPALPAAPAPARGVSFSRAPVVSQPTRIVRTTSAPSAPRSFDDSHDDDRDDDHDDDDRDDDFEDDFEDDFDDD